MIRPPRSRNRLLAALALSGVLGVMSSPSEAQITEAHIQDGTWHIGLNALWGRNARGEGRNLDIYPMFMGGKWVNALATARQFNTSIHLVEESNVAVGPDARTLAGRIQVLITPDTWVPKDGQAFTIEVELQGTLTPHDKGFGVGGTYTARRVDGQPIHDDVKVIEGTLGGGVGATETGWDNSRWSIPLNQVVEPGGIDRDLIVVSLGLADGKVNWGTIGLTAQARWPAVRSVPVDVSAFGPVSAAGIAQGSFMVTGRHLHPGGDPAQEFRIDLTARRVQGLSGAKAVITPVAGGDPVVAAGRGTATKGGGGPERGPPVIWRDDLNTDPWFVSVDGHQPVAPGEHPRLLFRKGDLPELRRRAATPEGQAIVARLRALLGNGGEAVPTVFNPTPAHNHDQSKDMPIGTFTTWHAAGFGFLYRLTGDPKYAGFARTCVEFMREGKMDIDNRYGWLVPGTDLRVGSVLAAMAYAYDFCYDAWPADYRREIALEIQNYSKVTASSAAGAAEKGVDPEPTTIAKLAGRNGYPPGSNHYGSLIGGTGVAMLAIHGDPGVDSATVALRLSEIESNIPRMLELGFGDAGFYAEGLPPSRLSANGGFVELLHALRVAAGRDYIESPRRNARWLTLRWIAHMGGSGFAQYPNRGIYGDDNLYSKGGLSHMGDFAFGFGAVAPAERAALLWTYRTFVEPFETGKYGLAGEARSFNAHVYPHHAVYALVHWPIGQEPVNPGTVLPRVVVDHIHGYILARNRWQDADDIIVTHHLDYGPRGYYRVADGKRPHDRPGRLRIWGHGHRAIMSTNTGEHLPIHFQDAPDGSYVLTTRGGPGLTGLAVDFSKASGADLVAVAIGPSAVQGAGDKDAANPKASFKVHVLKVGDLPAYVVTLQAGEAPAVKVEGDVVHVGAQTFRFADGRMQPGVFAGK